ncbi:MAG: DUF2975 domain-containing protein [Clostridiales bacterium]|uniref:DUF2975 domain-containing protein n=1 Tax=Clostridium sp. N3C TaxID=1776758 RepID=UPI00092DFAAB|nr:DUF2975 domain-containing protein [Clostridium sp. N3C]NLZ49377.1 DUF2975 domain-containing protein [Clostridiales bacterium]SCN24193.1 hypothetical protein N3C_1707 [Clostridium sp. N3C]
MKEGRKGILRLGAFLIVVSILTFFVFLLPFVLTGLSKVIPVVSYLRYSGLICLYGGIITFIFALYQTVKVLVNISKGKELWKASRGNLKAIKYSTIILSSLYLISMPFLYLMADKDDAPGILLFGLIVFLFSSASAVFASAFEKNIDIIK